MLRKVEKTELYKILKSTKGRKKMEDKSKPNKGNEQETVTNLVNINPKISVIILTVNVQICLLRERLSEQIKKI